MYARQILWFVPEEKDLPEEAVWVTLVNDLYGDEDAIFDRTYLSQREPDEFFRCDCYVYSNGKKRKWLWKKDSGIFEEVNK